MHHGRRRSHAAVVGRCRAGVGGPTHVRRVGERCGGGHVRSGRRGGRGGCGGRISRGEVVPALLAHTPHPVRDVPHALAREQLRDVDAACDVAAGGRRVVQEPSVENGELLRGPVRRPRLVHIEGAAGRGVCGRGGSLLGGPRGAALGHLPLLGRHQRQETRVKETPAPPTVLPRSIVRPSHKR